MIVGCINQDSKRLNAKHNYSSDLLLKFKKVTLRNTHSFQKLHSHIDTIEGIINNNNLHNVYYETPFKRWNSKYWKHKGRIIKIETDVYFSERQYTTQFYIFDQHKWACRKSKYHPLYKDSLMEQTLIYYKDTVSYYRFVQAMRAPRDQFYVYSPKNRFTWHRSNQLKEQLQLLLLDSKYLGAKNLP